jgi:hypothetical protein
MVLPATAVSAGRSMADRKLEVQSPEDLELGLTIASAE